MDSQNRLVLVSHIPLGVAVIDVQNHKYIEINSAWRQLLGLDESTAIGSTFCTRGNSSIICGRILELFSGFISQNQNDQVDQEIAFENGEPYRFLRVLFKYINLKKFVLVVIEDISERKSTELEKERLKIQALNAEKLGALSDMAAGVAHEVNNPLAIINAKTLFLKKALSLPKDQWNVMKIIESLEKIETTTQRIQRIVKSLRTVSRDGSSDGAEWVHISSIVSDVTELCKYRLNNKDIYLKYPEIIPENDYKIECQVTQIVQVLLNLINNSFDAVLDLPDRWIHFDVHLEQEDQWVVFTITDSGSGIPKEIAEKIMHPFFTTKEVGKGTGLGLSLAKGVALEHGGDLYLNSNSKNTEFILRIPRECSISDHTPLFKPSA